MFGLAAHSSIFIKRASSGGEAGESALHLVCMSPPVYLLRLLNIHQGPLLQVRISGLSPQEQLEAINEVKVMQASHPTAAAGGMPHQYSPATVSTPPPVPSCSQSVRTASV
jgi:hypothetical protein